MSETRRILDALIGCRKAQKMQQQLVAKRMGYTPERISQIERMKNPTFDHCASFARAIGYRLDVFITPVEAEPVRTEKQMELLELEEKIAAAKLQLKTLEQTVSYARKYLQRGIA